MKPKIDTLSIEESVKRAEEIGIVAQIAELNVFRTLLHHPKAAKAVNDLLNRIAAINSEIVQVEPGVGEASSLRDQRDVLVDELSQYMDLDVIEHENGSSLGGVIRADGARGVPMEPTSDRDPRRNARTRTRGRGGAGSRGRRHGRRSRDGSPALRGPVPRERTDDLLRIERVGWPRSHRPPGADHR